MSFPRTTGQLPIYYAHKTTGRPSPEVEGHVFYTHHMDVDNSSLFPFGYGLSYSTFEYGPISLSETKISPDGVLKAKVSVTNTSQIDGEEIVQLYIQDVFASITRPVLELKGFRKINIPAGETVEVEFEIRPKDLEFYSINKTYEAEEGEFILYIGPNSRDLQSLKFNYQK